MKEENSKPKETKNKKQIPISPTISAELDQRFTFSNFIVGKSNELAFAAARRVAESQNVPFNPLFLYGGVGLAKTHLMHAIAHEIAKRNRKKSHLFVCRKIYVSFY